MKTALWTGIGALAGGAIGYMGAPQEKKLSTAAIGAVVGGVAGLVVGNAEKAFGEMSSTTADQYEMRMQRPHKYW